MLFLSEPRLERLAAPKSTVTFNRGESSHSFSDDGHRFRVLLVLNVSESGCKQNLMSAITLIVI
jgi:geranylgeranyl pyrophosphate synthase